MGQQQLLLVILVTIIVGIATVVAINTFSSASDNANVDAVRNDLVNMGAAAQQYYMKPEALGGGGQDFDGLTTHDLGGVPGTRNSDTEIENENGTYTLSAVAGQNFTVTGVPATAGGSVDITIYPDSTVMGDYTPPTN